MPVENVDFCACSFMYSFIGNAYVYGECVQGRPVDSFFKFKAADCSIHEVSEMKNDRNCSACAPFKSKVVVSGENN